MRLLLIAAFAAAAFAQDTLQVPPPPPPPTPRPLMIEYLDSERQATIARFQSTSHREVVTRWGGDREVRTEIETACPDGYHMRVFHGGTLTTDFYRVDGTEYRHVNGAWKSSPAPRSGTNTCNPQRARQIAAMSDRWYQQTLQRLDLLAMEMHVAKGPIKTVHGVRCRQWLITRAEWNASGAAPLKTQPKRPAVITSTCVSLKEYLPVEQISPGSNPDHPIVTFYYDWNKPILIKPPVVEGKSEK